jgi:carnitine 3-dehydrogenase
MAEPAATEPAATDLRTAQAVASGLGVSGPDALGVRTVGLLGGGVIGGGWAARFLLAGVDVRLFDPDPEAERKLGEMLANARRAWRSLTAAPLPPEGEATVVASVADAVLGADFVQESAPERLGLKQALLAEADAAAPPGVVIASSTSGLRPSDLQAKLEHPDRFVVGHPFNPVYLLPLVEICGGSRTSAQAGERAAQTYRSVGMRPLLVRKEIDGFIADRLLEALWREALWLVADDVATVQEIDDALRFGAGLRFASMGTFLTYRIAGGEGGMRQFMEQFGPALQWPWTHLTDVPELTDGLLDKITLQSDEQAGGIGVRELERLRDDCVIGVLQGLRRTGYGAGAVVADYERLLEARAAEPAPGPAS